MNTVTKPTPGAAPPKPPAAAPPKPAAPAPAAPPKPATPQPAAAAAATPATPPASTTPPVEPPAAAPATPAAPDAREAQFQVQQRTWEREKVRMQNELRTGREQLAREREEFTRQQQQWLQQVQAPPAGPPKELPPEFLEALRVRDEKIDQLMRQDQQRTREAQVQRQQNALTTFAGVAAASKEHPLTAEMAVDNPTKFKAAAERILQTNVGPDGRCHLLDAEILDMIESELDYAVKLHTKRKPAPQDTPAPSDTPEPAAKTPPPATPAASTSLAPERSSNGKPDWRNAERARQQETMRAVAEAKKAAAERRTARPRRIG